MSNSALASTLEEAPITSMMRRLANLSERFKRGDVSPDPIGCAHSPYKRSGRSRWRLSESEKVRMRDLRDAGHAMEDIAAMLNCSRSSVRRVLTGEDDCLAKLMARPAVAEMVRLKAKGLPQCEIARAVDRSDAYVSQALRDVRRAQRKGGS